MGALQFELASKEEILAALKKQQVSAEQVEGFIDEKVDCILINAVDWKAIGSSLKKAKKQVFLLLQWILLVMTRALSMVLLSQITMKQEHSVPKI